MATPRDPIAVIDAVLAQVPADAKWDTLRAKLGRVRDDDPYRPPEDKSLTWYCLRRALEAELGPTPTTDWQRAISDIVEGRRPTKAEGATT